MSEWVEYITFNGVSPMADLRKANGHEAPWTIDYFGVGNENWGCGGNMRPEHLRRRIPQISDLCKKLCRKPANSESML